MGLFVFVCVNTSEIPGISTCEDKLGVKMVPFVYKDVLSFFERCYHNLSLICFPLEKRRRFR